MFDGGWGLVRASNTQPVLVLRFEAASAERLAEIRAAIDAHVEAARAAVPEVAVAAEGAAAEEADEPEAAPA